MPRAPRVRFEPRLPVEVVGGEGDEPVRFRVGGGQVAADLLAGAAHRLFIVQAARFEPGQTVDAWNAAEVGLGETHRGFGPVVLERTVEHVAAIRREHQLKQEAGKAAARLDHGDEAARGHIDALQQALTVEQNLAGEPVLAVREQESVMDRDRFEFALGGQHQRADFRLVVAQVQNQILDLAGQREGPERIARLHESIDVGRQGSAGPWMRHARMSRSMSASTHV